MRRNNSNGCYPCIFNIALHVSLLTASASAFAQASRNPSGSADINPIPEEFIIRKVSGKENPELIRDAHGINALYSLLLSLDEAGNGRLVAFAESNGFETDLIDQLLGIAKAGSVQAQTFARTAKESICTSDQFTKNLAHRANPETLYSALDSVDEQLAAGAESYFREELIRQTDELTYRQVMNWIQSHIKPNLNEVIVDYYRKDLASGRDPFYRFVRFCP